MGPSKKLLKQIPFFLNLLRGLFPSFPYFFFFFFWLNFSSASPLPPGKISPKNSQPYIPNGKFYFFYWARQKKAPFRVKNFKWKKIFKPIPKNY